MEPRDHFLEATKITSQLLSDYALISNDKWMMHAGGALHFYRLSEVDLSDIDFVIAESEVEKLRDFVVDENHQRTFRSIHIKRDRRYSAGIYAGACLEFLVNGIPVHIFNPQISRTIINGESWEYSFDEQSFDRAKNINGTLIAPIEDIFIYKLILQRSNKDNKRDVEQLADILHSYKFLDLQYLREKIVKHRLESSLFSLISKFDHISQQPFNKPHPHLQIDALESILFKIQNFLLN